MSDNPFVGSWTYRSFSNDPDINTDLNKLLFGNGTIEITAPSSDTLGAPLAAASVPGLVIGYSIFTARLATALPRRCGSRVSD